MNRIYYGKHHLDEDDINAVIDVLRGDLITQGPVIEDFEKSVADYVGARFAVAVSSGTAALHLAVLAAGVIPDTTLITTPITFVSSANAGLYAGANVALADIDPETVNISPDSLGRAITANPDTKAIIPVHFAGLPCNMQHIKSLADQAGVTVIEDAAHALGALYPNGDRVGSCSYSQMTIFSFHPVKMISTGEGGMITTNDESLYRKLMRLRSHGINKFDDEFLENDQAYTGDFKNPWYYEMQELGYHYRITDIQCALGISQLQKLDRFLKRRRDIVSRYDSELSEIDHVTPAQKSGRMLSSHHLYVLRINFAKLGLNRAKLILDLKERGIFVQIHYLPIYMHPFYKNKLGICPSEYPHSNHYYEEAISIPLYYDLTDDQQTYVIETLKQLIIKKI